MVQAEDDSFKLALQALAKNMLRSHGVSTFEESTAWNTDCFPSCQLLHRAQLQLMVALLGVTVGEQYQQLWEAASEAERRPKHAEEQEIDQLDLDHAEQGIPVDFHTKKKITTLDIKAEMTLAAKWGKNPTTCSFSSQCKSREPNTSRLFYVSTPAARPFKYLYKGPK